MNRRGLLAVVIGMIAELSVSAHPSSGLVVTDAGDVFFVHSGRGVAKIERDGTLTYVKRSSGGHWLCLDREGVFAHTQPKFFERVTAGGVKPALIFADGGAPIVVCRDRNLYFASNWQEGSDAHPPGGLTVSRVSADGKLSHVSMALKNELAKSNEGVTGLAAGPDGLLYIASPSSIFKVTTNGQLTVIAHPAVVNDCDENLPPNWRAPGFRGLALATNETVFAAATGCRRVVKLLRAGEVTTVLKCEPPWNPTDVALHTGDVYVLEWTNANGGVNDGWRPRVRKLTRGGAVLLLVEVKENVGR